MDGLDGVEILEDFEAAPDGTGWVLHLRIHIESSDQQRVPSTTEWYLIVQDPYPWGSIDLFPAKNNGLAGTFPHQRYNGEGTEDEPWRDGNICVRTPYRVLERLGLDREPDEVHRRIRWNVERAQAWLLAASDECLAEDGAPFELPDLPDTSDTRPSVAFAEDQSSLEAWSAVTSDHGLVHFVEVKESPRILAVGGFDDVDSNEVRAVDWGSFVQARPRHESVGAWIRLPAVPHLEPWQAPRTWGELRSCCAELGIDLDEKLDALRPTLGGWEDHVLLIGFPVPRRFGEAADRIHWWALHVPSRKSTAPPWGGARRGTNQGRRFYERTEILDNDKEVEWLKTENWAPDELGGRGQLSEALRHQRIAVVGTGAVGCVVAELLVRGGVVELVLVDGDRFEAGNLVRHTLGANELSKNKAEQLAKRLNTASPHARVIAIGESFPPETDEDREALLACGLVIDCTGSDEAAAELERFPWKGERAFVSCSLGMHARRAFVFFAQGGTFPLDAFREEIGPWLEREYEEYRDEELPREGVGCWHPVYPAKAHDIWMMAGAIVQILEGFMDDGAFGPRLDVIEKGPSGEGPVLVRNREGSTG